MLRIQLLLSFTILTTTFWALDAPAQDRPGDLVVTEDTLVRIDPQAGSTLWSIRHASVWKTSEHRRKQSTIQEPVLVDDTLYYGLGSWLMEVDWEEGVIRERHWFPSKVVGIEAGGDQLAVTVEAEHTTGDGSFEQVFRWTPGTPTTGEVWSYIGFLATWKDATYLGGGVTYPDANVGDAQTRVELERIQRRAAQEPSNPFYDYCVGVLYDRLGEPERAEAAYTRAADTEGSHWSSYLSLAAYLDRVRQFDLADRAFEKAKDAIESNERVQIRLSRSLVSKQIMLGWRRDTLSEAVENEEFDNVDRMHERIAWTYPYLEQSWRIWPVVADWYEENGRPELADKWRGHAERAPRSPWHAIDESLRRADLSIALLVGFGFAAWPALFIIGARRARRKDDGWLVPPRLGELIGVTAVMLAPLPLLFVQQQSTVEVGMVASLPLEVLDGSWSSKNVANWVEDLEDSPQKEALATRVQQVANARLAGEVEVMTLEDYDLVIDAVDRESRVRAWEKLTTTMKPEILQESSLPSLPTLLPGWMAVMAVFYLMGTFVGSRYPRATHVLQKLVPGGASSAGFATAFVVALSIASLGSILFGIDSIIQQIGMPTFAKYFGLESIYTEEMAEPTHKWAWAVLGVVLVVHFATHWLDVQREHGELTGDEDEA